DSVKQYFRDVEVQARDDDRGAEERHVEVPNQVKVIFIGHQEAGKSDVIKGLVGGSVPFASASDYTGAAKDTPPSQQQQQQQQGRFRGVPPRTPTRAPQPPSPSPLKSGNGNDDDKAQGDDGGGWQVVGTGRQRPVRVPPTPPRQPPLPANQSQDRSGTPAPSTHGTGGVSGFGKSGGGGRRWETVASGGALGQGRHEWAGGSGVGTRDADGPGGGGFSSSSSSPGVGKSPSIPDSPNQVAMDIQTATYTPTISYHKGRKHLTGEEWVAVDRAKDGGGGGTGRGDNAADVENPRLSGYGAGGEADGEGGDADIRSITLKFWDFGGTEEFHAVHGLFFSGRALYTVVFDLRHVERNEIDQRVQFWVDCVQSRVPGSLIVLVGTHADSMTDAEAQARIQKVQEQVSRSMSR
ncbi:unnamed protein product, partial [Hapterophycus canaliculatus]